MMGVEPTTPAPAAASLTGTGDEEEAGMPASWGKAWRPRTEIGPTDRVPDKWRSRGAIAFAPKYRHLRGVAFTPPLLMPASVLVIGSFNQDIAFDVPAFPAPGETVLGAFRVSPGGKGFNQAVAATRTGVPTTFVGAVGADAYGRAAPKLAQALRVKAHFITKPKQATGVAVVTVDASGQNRIVIAPGANLALQAREVPAHLFATAKVVVCQGETSYTALAQWLRLARRQGAVTILNPAPMRAGFDPAVLRHTDVLIANELEFSALLRVVPGATPTAGLGGALSAQPPEAWHRLCRGLGVPTVIVTRGAEGLLLSQAHEHTWIHAHDVEAVDTTGAGDAFVGGFAAGLVKFQRNAVEAAHYANAVAALSVLQPGAAPAMPSAREIARFRRLHDHR